jgi:hypothetical protein
MDVSAGLDGVLKCYSCIEGVLGLDSSIIGIRDLGTSFLTDFKPHIRTHP